GAPDHRHSAVPLRPGLADGEGAAARRLYRARSHGLPRRASAILQDRLLDAGGNDLSLHHLGCDHASSAGCVQRPDLTWWRHGKALRLPGGADYLVALALA